MIIKCVLKTYTKMKHNSIDKKNEGWKIVIVICQNNYIHRELGKVRKLKKWRKTNRTLSPLLHQWIYMGYTERTIIRFLFKKGRLFRLVCALGRGSRLIALLTTQSCRSHLSLTNLKISYFEIINTPAVQLMVKLKRTYSISYPHF